MPVLPLSHLELGDNILAYMDSLGVDSELRDVANSPYYKDLGPNPRADGTLELRLTTHVDASPMKANRWLKICPVQLAAMDLPPALRSAIKNTVLASFYMGNSAKPNLLRLLESVLSQFDDFELNPLELNSDGRTRRVVPCIVQVSCDLVARAQLTSMKQYNGEYGCLFCTHPGERHHDGSRLYKPSPQAMPRTPQHFIENYAEIKRVLGLPVADQRRYKPAFGFKV